MRIPLFLLAVVVAVGACSKPDKPNSGTTPGTNPNPPGQTPVAQHFTADLPNEFLLNFGKHDHTWKVDTDVPNWTVTSDQAWCQAQAVENGLLILVDSYEEKDADGNYVYLQPRVCNLSVNAGTVFSKTFKVVQESHLSLDLPEGQNGILSVELSPDGGTREVIVRCNSYVWTASSEAAWLKLERKDNATLLVTSSARGGNETAQRSAQVKVYTPSDTQLYWIFTVSDTPTSYGGEDLGYGDHTGWD